MKIKIINSLIVILLLTGCAKKEKIKTTEDAPKTLIPYGAKDYCKRNQESDLCGQKK